MGNRPASDYDAIEDARENVAGIRELERVSKAFEEASQTLGDPRSGLWAGMTTDLVLRFAPDQETIWPGTSVRSRPKGPPQASFWPPTRESWSYDPRLVCKRTTHHHGVSPHT